MSEWELDEDGQWTCSKCSACNSKDDNACYYCKKPEKEYVIGVDLAKGRATSIVNGVVQDD